MAGIIVWEDKVPIPGHYHPAEVVLEAVTDFLRLRCFLSDIIIDDDRGFDRHFCGKAPEGVGAWTTDGVRVFARVKDWIFDEINNEATTFVLVQLEQH